MNAPIPANHIHPRGTHQIGDTPLALTGIFDENTNIAIWQRPANARIATLVNSLASSGALGGGWRTVLDMARPLAPALRPHLPPDSDSWLREIAGLAELYADLLGCPQVGVRLEVVEHAMCPRFHVDRVGIRLLCTYRGPATEWLDNAAADRRWLGSASGGLPDTASGLILDPSGIHAAEAWSVVLLKGDLWQGNSGNGIIHRSPAIPPESGPRILVAMDAAWDSD
jgi:hypothetical protein